jgi:hypothetical protein
MQPNGKIKVIGFLPKWWSYFIEYKKGIKNIYYEGEAEQAIIKNLPIGFNMMPQEEVEQIIGCKFKIVNEDIFFFIEETDYVLPEWIRNPLSECPTCMASVYGSAIYFLFVYCVKDVFLFTNHAAAAFFLFWILFLVILSYGINFLSKNR